jgi:hypothetical protein
MLRGTPGFRLINPGFSNPTIIWCTADPLTWKKRCMSLSAADHQGVGMDEGQVLPLTRGKAGSRIA